MSSESKLCRWARLRPPRAALGFVALAWCALLGMAQAAPRIAAVDSIGITVSDLTRSTTFYRDVLGFEVVSDKEVSGAPYERLYGLFGVRLRVVRMRLGAESIELMQFLAPRGRPNPIDTRSNDRWFQHVAIIVSDMDRAYARLRQFNVAHASSGPQRLPEWNPNAGGIQAFYFRDPDDNHLELLQFPPGKGSARWQAKDRLFLGIDHTAIVVSDTERSLAYYRDRLGLSVAGASENYGTEQEHLNNVFGARLRITALRAPAGPGIEFLEYLAPRNGRPIPADTVASDLWYWQINLRVDPAAALDAAGTRDLPSLVSSLPVEAGVSELGIARGLVARDPDGHASLLYAAP
jgi:catechol 2,3-dioxygenase-like lactoylglutathione lyase family enzyme